MTPFRKVLLDTSAIVAIFQPKEQNHKACVQALELILPPFATTWPVFTEAHYLLRQDPQAQAKLMSLMKSDAVNIYPLDLEFIEWFEGFTAQYGDQDVQIADASLVWVGEHLRTNKVFTLDRRDFSIFRVNTDAFEITP